MLGELQASPRGREQGCPYSKLRARRDRGCGQEVW